MERDQTVPAAVLAEVSNVAFRMGTFHLIQRIQMIILSQIRHKVKPIPSRYIQNLKRSAPGMRLPERQFKRIIKSDRQTCLELLELRLFFQILLTRLDFLETVLPFQKVAGCGFRLAFLRDLPAVRILQDHRLALVVTRGILKHEDAIFLVDAPHPLRSSFVLHFSNSPDMIVLVLFRHHNPTGGKEQEQLSPFMQASIKLRASDTKKSIFKLIFQLAKTCFRCNIL